MDIGRSGANRLPYYGAQGRAGVADWRDAVQDRPDGVRILVEVAAGAKDERFPDGWNPWRDGRIGVRVRAAAQDNRANVAVVACVARFFGLPTANVSLESGATDSRKALVVRGILAAHALERLAPLLEKP